MADNRYYTSRRQGIISAIVDLLKNIDGSGEYLSNVYGNVLPRMAFWDEIEEYPAIHVNAGSETRTYQPGDFKDRFLTVTIRCYVNNEDDPILELDRLLEDVETVLEDNSRLSYYDKRGNPEFTHQITVLSVDSDEGALRPLGVGQITAEVRY